MDGIELVSLIADPNQDGAGDDRACGIATKIGSAGPGPLPDQGSYDEMPRPSST
jgi:hypothetical protein